VHSDNSRGVAFLWCAGLVRHKNLIILTLIVILAFAVRVIDVTDNPPGFFTDEAAAGLDAQAIWQTGKDMHDKVLPFFFENLGDYKLPIFIYAEVPFVAVLGLSEFTVRITVVLMGTLTVATTYLLDLRVLEEIPYRDGSPAFYIGEILSKR
jgi:predicted membrane-bound mannosyltransferase